jgi:hypothetical protein
MLLVSWDCRISAYTNSRKKKETDRVSYKTELSLNTSRLSHARANSCLDA